MNRSFIAGIVFLLTSGGSLVAAQTAGSSTPPSTSAPSPGPKNAPPTKAEGLNPGTTNNGMMGPGMMGMCPGMSAGTQGPGMMGGGMMGGGLMGTCPGASARDTKMHVTKQPKGASIVITSDDPKIVACLQSRADGSGGCMMGGQGAAGHMMGQGAAPPAGANGAGTCSGMMGPGTDAQVAKVPKGISFTMTGSDAKAVSRIQKMAEAMRLMHEAMAD